MFVRGIRGAITVSQNTAQEILSATEELLKKMLEVNQIQAADIVSIFFTLTPDLNAEFPAVAARKLGLESTALLCMTEIPVPHGLPKCIRILIHAHTVRTPREIQTVYLKDAITLRPDSAVAK